VSSSNPASGNDSGTEISTGDSDSWLTVVGQTSDDSDTRRVWAKHSVPGIHTPKHTDTQTERERERERETPTYTRRHA